MAAELSRNSELPQHQQGDVVLLRRCAGKGVDGVEDPIDEGVG